MDADKGARVALLMGSRSDWDCMRCAADCLDELRIAHIAEVVSAHRTPELLSEVARNAEQNGWQVIIAGAGGAAHLPGMLAAQSLVPVLGVPMPTRHLGGQDSLLSIVQMPRGVPVGTLAIGTAGALNAALLAAAILSLGDAELRERLRAWRNKQSATVLADRKLP